MKYIIGFSLVFLAMYPWPATVSLSTPIKIVIDAGLLVLGLAFILVEES